MSINVTLYNNFTKRKNSTKQPAENTGTDFLCVLKSPTVVTAPKIEISLASGSPTGYTYAYIPIFNRYYFIDEWEYTIGTWTASLIVDVLASFKSEIESLQPYVLRSSSAYDEDISDGYYPATNSWASYERNIPFALDYSNRTFVIGLISPPSYDASTLTQRSNELGSIAYYLTDGLGIARFINYLMSDDFVNASLIDVASGVTNQVVKDFVDPLTYIASITMFPFDAQGSTAFLPAVPIKMGWWDFTNVSQVPQMKRLDTLYKHYGDSTTYIDVPKNLYASTGKEFLAFPPYVQYELNFQPFGVLPLNASYLGSREKMYLGLDVDLVTGAGRLSIGSNDGRADLGVYNAQIGVPVTVAQITTDILGASVSVLDSVTSAGANLVSGNLAGAGTSLAHGILNTIDALKPQTQTTGSNGSILSYTGSNKGPTLIMRYCNCVEVDNEHFGRPLCKKITSIGASTTGSYLLCADGENHVNCYESEKERISGFLTGGFFYE